MPRAHALMQCHCAVHVGSGLGSNAAAAVSAALKAGEAATNAAKANGKGTATAAIFTGQAASYTVVATIDAFLGKRSLALAAAAAAGGTSPLLLQSVLVARHSLHVYHLHAQQVPIVCPICHDA